MSGGKGMGGERVRGVESRETWGGRGRWMVGEFGGWKDGEEGSGGNGRPCEGRGAGIGHHGD